MTFANRAILVGLLALGIPLAIHLLGRRRARKVILPTARFAEGVHASSRGRLWLKRVGLLVLRLAVVALLVLALAGPRVGGTDPSADGPWVLVLDTSPSMQAKGPDGVTALERGRRRLLAVAEALPDARPTVLLAPRPRTDGATAAQVRQALRERPFPAGEDLPLQHVLHDAMTGSAAGSASETVPVASPARGAAASHVVLATDATPHALRGMAAGSLAMHKAQVVLLPVGGAAGNVWLGVPRAGIAPSPRGRVLEVTVTPGGETGGAPVEVFLQLDGRQTEHTVVAPAGDAARFRIRADGDGPWQGRVYVKADDALAVDNVRYFTAAVRRPIRVLVVDAAEEDGVRVRSADLVAAAFAAGAGVPKPVTRLRADRADRPAFDAADVVFWVGSQPPRQIGDVKEFVSRGGAVVWLPADAGPPTDADFATWLGTGEVPGVEEPPDGVTLDPAGYTSDLLGAFEGGTSGDLNAPVCRRRLRLPHAPGTVIRFRDGLPAVQSHRQDGGRLVVLAFGVSPRWSDLSGRAEFVVLAHSLAEALAPADGPQVANLVAGNTAGIRPTGQENVPGNYVFPAGEAAGTHYSVNVDPHETSDLAPLPDDLAAAFGEGRVRVLSGDFSPRRAIPAVSEPLATDLSPLLIVALAVALAAESLLSASQSRRR